MSDPCQGSDFPPSLRKQIGVAFETPALYEKLSGEENLRFFAALQDADGESLKVAFQAAADLGLEGDLSKPVGAYSKGMKVRLNYCRALVHNPRLLFLDEPGAGLDPLLQVRLREHILRQKESGRTIILTTHNMELAEKLCDRLGIISSGKLKALENPDVLKAAYGEQLLEIRTSSAIEKFPLDGLASNARFLGLLESPDLRSVRTLDASMEQVFIAVSDEQ
ncbi:ABC transporter ATP-binding protein [Salinispira pacifica]|uniref:ABC transporter ATP-binding protein n=1 Tax=Salinispira pacifica TaxID=1307761 RepID=UPI00244E48AB|nr:ABC transporter ATP-binding protein [Salinispira pacifica]